MVDGNMIGERNKMTMPSDTRFTEREALFIASHTDEVSPCTADDWAAYLAGSENWHGEQRDALAKNGDRFAALIQPYRYVPTHRLADGTYQIEAPQPGWRLFALAIGDGKGWTSDMMITRSDDLHRQLMAEDRDATDEEDAADAIAEATLLLARDGGDPVEYLVHAGTMRNATVIYHTDPLRCDVIEEETP